METSVASRPAAPAVVAVMVTRNPGPWFDECLAALAAQEYANLAVLIVDAASDSDPTSRVAAVLPDAFVRRLDGNPGYGAAANEVANIVDGAAFYCFLHDDAAPAPTAIGTMVSEALRSNAGVVGCKFVQFDDPRRLLTVGESADKTGERVSPVEPGEIDQEQHDSVRDVFIASGGCVLVRSDLFHEVGGFDPGIDFLNDDLNFSWRAHLAGARVVVAPDAVVRHIEAFDERQLDTVTRRRRGGPASRRERLMRHRIWTMLTCYSRWHRIRVVPQAMVIAVLEIVVSVLVGRRGQAREVIGAWRWNLGRRSEIREARRHVEEFRTIGDGEIRRLQARGSARAANYFRSQQRGGTRSDQAQEAIRRGIDGFRDGSLRWPITAWIVTLLIVGLGSRHLLTGPIPAVGGFMAFDRGPFELLGDYVSGWRDVGLGTESPAPTGLGLLGVLGTFFLGAMGTLRRVLLLGSVLLGLIGAYRLTGPTGSPRTQAAALVVYGSIPLAYDSIAHARWDALTIYGAMPWILYHLATIAGWEPFGGLRSSPQRRRFQILRLGLLVALVSAITPAVLVLVVVVTVGLVVGSLLTSGVEQAPRLLVAVVGAFGVSALLHLPWLFDFVLPGSTWEMIIGNRSTSDLSFAEVLRFDAGPVGASVLAFGLLIAAALPLLIGSEWRFEWAVRGWVVALTSFLLTWADAQGWLPLPTPAPAIMLAPAAAGLAVAVALGVAAFEIDLPGYDFGWRQAAAGVAGIAFLLGAFPTLLDAGNGRWYLPAHGLGSTFAFVEGDDADFRMLWIGDPVVMPVPGYRLGDDLVYATTDNGLPALNDAWPGSAEGPTRLIADALGVARDGDTSRLGRLLAPMAIRYVVLPNAAAPRPGAGVTRPAPAELIETFDGQLDLAPVLVNPSFTVYRNEAAVSSRSSLGDERLGTSIFDLSPSALAAAVPVLTEVDGDTSFRGSVPAGTVLHAAAHSGRWSLDVDGAEVTSTKLYGWADGYEVSADGEGTLRYDTSPLRYLMVLVQALFWMVALGAYILDRPVRGEGSVGPAVAEDES